MTQAEHCPKVEKWPNTVKVRVGDGQYQITSEFFNDIYLDKNELHWKHNII